MELFHPSLMFVGKAGAYPRELLIWLHYKGCPIVSPVQPIAISMIVTNTLAYYRL
jgi:hypothetical protein